jgi:hypothetical protein
MDMESDVVVCDWLRSHIINAVGSAGFITDKGYYPTQIALCAAELVKRGGTFKKEPPSLPVGGFVIERNRGISPAAPTR